MIHLPKSLIRPDGTWRHRGGDKSPMTARVKERGELVEAALSAYSSPIPIQEGGRLFRRIVDDLTHRHPVACAGLTEAHVSDAAQRLGLWPWTPKQIDLGANPMQRPTMDPLEMGDAAEAAAWYARGKRVAWICDWLGCTEEECVRWIRVEKGLVQG